MQTCGSKGFPVLEESYAVMVAHKMSPPLSLSCAVVRLFWLGGVALHAVKGENLEDTLLELAKTLQAIQYISGPFQYRR